MPNDPPRDPTEVAARLRMAMMRMVRRIKRETASEHSVSAISALATLKRLDGTTVGELAEAEGVSRPSMTVLAAGLLQHGLVVREADQKDGRRVRLKVTPAGSEALEESRTRRNAYLARRLRGVGPGDLHTLDEAAAILEHLLENAP